MSLTLGAEWVINGYRYIGTADGTLFFVGPGAERFEGVNRNGRTSRLLAFIKDKKAKSSFN